MSDSLISYSETSSHSNISQFHVKLKEIPNLDILLFDDPDSLVTLQPEEKPFNANVIIYAFDPLQFRYGMTDDSFKSWQQKDNVIIHTLGTCYRQKENVGKATKHIVDTIANSTPFLRKDKIKDYRENRKEITELVNNLVFLNPHGYIEYYPDSTVSDVQNEVERILDQEWLMWKHWPGLLIVLDDIELSEATNVVLSPLMRINYVNTIYLDEIEKVKGLEFQHVFIFIQNTLFDEIQSGFKGSGQKTYEQRRLLRIPFSRAKDSLVTFVVDDNE